MVQKPAMSLEWILERASANFATRATFDEYVLAERMLPKRKLPRPFCCLVRLAICEESGYPVGR